MSEPTRRQEYMDAAPSRAYTGHTDEEILQDTRSDFQNESWYRREISDEVGMGWKGLASHLGMSQNKVEFIQQNNSGHVQDAAAEILVIWRRQMEPVAKLHAALLHIHRKDLAAMLLRAARESASVLQ